VKAPTPWSFQANRCRWTRAPYIALVDCLSAVFAAAADSLALIRIYWSDIARANIRVALNYHVQSCNISFRIA